MATYEVEFEAKAFFRVKVEADDFDQAAEKAGQQLPPNLCAQCSGWSKPWSLEIQDDPACWEVVEPFEGNEG